jgi:POT family proton-dependent oligopeptide transporter
MLLSLIIFTVFNRHIREAATKVPESSAEVSAVSTPEARGRILVLLVVFVISTVFWLAWYQIFYTFAFWARDNTATTFAPEQFPSVESLGVIVLSPVLVGLWAWLQRRQAEPSTPVKMVMGVGLVAFAFALLGYAGLTGGDTGRVSAAWLVSANLIMALGEITLGPMGMSLVNRLAPPRMRGLMMGGWFVATAIGNKLTVIGRYWTEWYHSSFWLLCSLLALGMAIVLVALLKSLKRAMPGV